MAADPLLFPRRYREPGDVEAAAFVAASFAFGSVPQILSFLERLFAVVGPSPHAALSGDRPVPPRRLAGLRYRFISPAGVHRFLFCAWTAYREHGSLEALYRRGIGSPPRERLARFLDRFRAAWGEDLPRERDFLFPDPRRGSACKRHNLFLRWMARGGDGVDLGIWTAVSPRDLVAPVDTHVARLGRWLDLTGRKTADWRMAEEITEAFRSVCPGDPLKYDYALTRIGILGECGAARRGACPLCPLAPACRRADHRTF